MSRHIQIESFGQLSDGREALLFTLTNSNGQTLKVTNHGGIITSLTAVDRNGNFSDIVLGYDDIEQYERDPYYLGAIIGRYAGRIDEGKLLVARSNCNRHP